jgi:hypothetical protein
MRKFTIEDCKKVAGLRGGKFLDDAYLGTHHKHMWKCAKGHIWESSFNNVKRKSWCPECHGNKKKDIKFCKEIAKTRGGLCLSDRYINSDERMLWQCQKGHRWRASLSNLISAKSWCPYCSHTKMKDLNFCIQEAEKRGGKFLSEKYINTKTHYKWECKNGHHWMSTLDKIANANRWCPNCWRGKSQKEIVEILQVLILKESEVVSNYRGFAWLRNPKTGYPLEIDILIRHKNKTVAIEYDGWQHYEPVEQWGGSEAFEKLKYRDAIKNKLIAEHPEEIDHFIRIPYWEEISEENIRKILQENQIL